MRTGGNGSPGNFWKKLKFRLDRSPGGRYNVPCIEAWLSLVERCVRDAEVAGSNPVASTGTLGPLVKRLRRRPLTAETGVRFPYGLF